MPEAILRSEENVATLRERNGTYFADYRINGRRFRKNLGRAKRIAELALK